MARNRGASLSDIFNHEAARIQQDYPQLRDRFGIIYVDTGHFFGQLAHERTDFKSQDDMLSYLAEALQNTKEHPAAQVPFNACADKGHGVNLVLICGHKDLTKSIAGRKPRPLPEELAQKTLMTLDHELGHLIVQDAYHKQDGDSYAESAADAFSAIRHVQRFGLMTDDIEVMIAQRALDALLDPNTHGYFTAAALDRIQREKFKTDFAALTPEETRLYAARVARECAPSPQEEARLRLLLAPAQQKMIDTDGDYMQGLDMLRRLVGAHPKDEGLLQLCRLALLPIMHHDVFQTQDWQKVRRILTPPKSPPAAPRKTA